MFCAWTLSLLNKKNNNRNNRNNKIPPSALTATCVFLSYATSCFHSLLYFECKHCKQHTCYLQVLVRKWKQHYIETLVQLFSHKVSLKHAQWFLWHFLHCLYFLLNTTPHHLLGPASVPFIKKILKATLTELKLNQWKQYLLLPCSEAVSCLCFGNLLLYTVKLMLILSVNDQTKLCVPAVAKEWEWLMNFSGERMYTIQYLQSKY